MIDAIWRIITAPIGRAVSALLAAALAVFGVYQHGRKRQRQETALDAAERYAKTRKEMDDAPDYGNDPDAARRWLRERNPDQR